MNRTEAKNLIEQHHKKISRPQRSIEYCTVRINRLKKQLKDLETELQESQATILLEEVFIESLENDLKHEANCKRKVTNLLKKYPSLYLDDESDHSAGEHGTYLWLYCGLFDESNEEDDPYYDFHYMDDWAECLERCETYIKLIEKTREVA